MAAPSGITPAAPSTAVAAAPLTVITFEPAIGLLGFRHEAQIITSVVLDSQADLKGVKHMSYYK